MDDKTLIVNPEAFVGSRPEKAYRLRQMQEQAVIRNRNFHGNLKSRRLMCEDCIAGKHCGMCSCVCREIAQLANKLAGGRA